MIIAATLAEAEAHHHALLALMMSAQAHCSKVRDCVEVVLL